MNFKNILLLQYIVIAIFISQGVYSQVILVQNADFTVKANQVRLGQEWNTNNWQTNYSIYGWIKIEKDLLSEYKESTIFHLTSNKGIKFQNNQNPGDRVLSCFINHDTLIFSTYSTIVGLSDIQQKVKVEKSMMDKWVFIYQGYSHSKKQMIVYINSEDKQPIKFIVNGISHLTSTYYKIEIGQSNRYEFFPGKIQRLTLQGGLNSYKENNFQELMVLNPNNMPECPTVYSQCGFTGEAKQLCDPSSHLKINPDFQSIYLPNNLSVSTRYPKLYKNVIIEFKQSIECISNNTYISLLNGKFISLKKQGLNSSSENVSMLVTQVRNKNGNKFVNNY